MSRRPKLRIVSVNDVYLLDNLARLKTLWEQVRTEADTSILVMAGDFVAPSVLSSLDFGRGMVDCMNAVGFTHAVLGNHEDDIEYAELSQRVAELECICLGTNLPEFTPALAARDIVTVEGNDGAVHKIGLVGVTMHDRSIYNRAPFGGTRLDEANASACAEGSRLLREGQCEALVAITHQPIKLDRELTHNQPKLLAIIGGHEHQVILERELHTWIVKAGMDAFHAAITDIVWHEDGTLHTCCRLEDVTSYAEDPAVKARADQHLQQVRSLESATLLRLGPGEELSSVGARLQQTSLGTLLAGSVRACLDADFALLNGGAVRGNTTYTERFSYGDLQREVPFSNEIVVVGIPGAIVEAAIVASRSKLPLESGGFLQTCDQVQLDDQHRIVAVAGVPFDPQRRYRVALVRNFFAGMDDITPLIDFAHNERHSIPASGSGRDVKLVLLESFARHLWHKIGAVGSIDHDGDGTITKSELTRSIQAYTGDADPSIAAGIVKRALDRDGNGIICEDELPEPPEG